MSRWYKVLGNLCLVVFGLVLVTLAYMESVRSVWGAAEMPLVGKVIVIDPGHGGPDGGAVSKEGIVEKEIALRVALFLHDFLQQSGAKVIMTRDKDTDLADPETERLSKRKSQDLARRIQLIRKIHPDVFVSIHINSFPSSRWRGAQTFYNPVREENKKLASFIQESLIHYLENTFRVPKQKNDVFILKQSPVPTALVEIGFLSNSSEAVLLASRHYQKKVAAAIYYGILNYYSGKKTPEFTV
ncbi:N-acetylmuramoyl-L-alanine amidase CwlD [Thermoflavimicrobium dichotomicum]|nr:N-acetylmuramoyl-L-alanine amidase CwlD [Thermoflavimicrobium dichotomicum]